MEGAKKGKPPLWFPSIEKFLEHFQARINQSYWSGVDSVNYLIIYKIQTAEIQYT